MTKVFQLKQYGAIAKVFRDRLGAAYGWNLKWRNVPEARLISELPLGEWGGSHLFVADINDDGVPEFLWLQSAGMFKSNIYLASKAFLRSQREPIFCLTATDIRGNVLWQAGRPYSGSEPYVSHATDCMVHCADVDNDGHTEVLTFDGSDGLLMLDGQTGRTRKHVKLPSDNFAVMSSAPSRLVAGGVAIVVGVCDRAYEPHDYGNPWLFLDKDLEIVAQGDYLGAGHHVAVLYDADGGDSVFLIGYQLIDGLGRVLWTVDRWVGRSIDAEAQHVDYPEVFWVDGRWYAALAGSDRLYCIDEHGRTLWERELPHPQCCAFGKHGSEHCIFVVNQREVMNCFDLRGNELWSGVLPENWPGGRPSRKAFGPRPIHLDEPVIKVRSAGVRPDYLLYKEGGWPYGINWFGKPVVKYQFPANARKRSTSSYRRINDIGLSYEAVACDLDRDGDDEVVIYDRRFAWIYGHK